MKLINKRITDYLNFIYNSNTKSINTLKAYKYDLIQYYDFCISNRYDILNINNKELTLFIKYLRDIYDDNSVSRKLIVIRNFYKYLIIKKDCEYNPFSFVKFRNKYKILPNYIPYIEFRNILDKLDQEYKDNRNKLILLFLFNTGVRVSELINIRIKDIDINNRTVYILGKGNKERIVFINNEIVNLLGEYKYRDYLFLNNDGNRITTRGIQYILNDISKKLDLKIKLYPHLFRHSFATHLVLNGMDIRYVQILLGHENVDTTMIYFQLSLDYIFDSYESCHIKIEST